MKPRLIRLQGKYEQAEYTGENTSGVRPIAKRILILTDVFGSTWGDGNQVFLDSQVEKNNEAAESGTLVAMGEAAFSLYGDGSRWTGIKPEAGASVYFEKYAGVYVMGNDGKRYRLMEDSCVGAIYTVYAKEEGNAEPKE